MRKNILITGCSSGIGYDAAKKLKYRGWRVFATCRQKKDCIMLSKEGFESFVLDYAQEDSITSALETIKILTGGKLDAIFNNGAFAIPGAVEDLSREALRAIFEVNFFGPIELMNKALPLLRESNDGRVINCSSVLGFAALPYRGAYNASKFALEGITDTIRREKTAEKIKFILIEPGPINTKIRSNSIQYFERWIDWEKSPLFEIYQKVIIPRLYKKTDKKEPFELECSAVTKKLIHALESKRPRERYYVTYPTVVAKIIMTIFPTKLQDFFLRK
jgi:NAD(P)-dependent dehydrogenase (short-subunit alcohol dehydrogenase family)